MNPYNFTLLFFAFCSFLISLLILFKRRDEIGWVYLIFSISVAGWAAFISITFDQHSSYETALWSARVANLMAVFIPVSWFHFVSVVCDKWQRLKIIVWLLYTVSFGVACFSFTPYFVPKLTHVLGFAYFVYPGPLHVVFTTIFFIIVPYGFFELIKYAQLTRNKKERKQLIGFIIATFFGFFGGSFGFLPVYNIMIPQYGYFLMPFYPFVMAYFMIRHHLFDLEAVAEAFQREKLATMGLLAASINHEIKNPLYIAKGILESYLENKKEGLQSKDPDEVTSKALAQLDRISEIIQKMNRLVKPRTNQASEIQKASIPIALKVVLDLVSHEFKLDNIVIQNETPEDLSLVQADQFQLEEILFNLIVNSCHAMSATKRGGTLTIRPRTYDAQVILEIADTGNGITADQMKHIFEPFYTSKGEKGTGLGLYITKQLIEHNGGKIKVESREGKGAAFLLIFKM